MRIGFSSLSLLQKLFHTQSPAGRIWAPAEWEAELGLPRPEELRGLDLRVKSLFVLPFCVMHPKFVVVDERVAWLPSCNVSWERWFEGAVKLEGEVVRKEFVRFWEGVWDVDGDDGDDENEGSAGSGRVSFEREVDLEAGIGAGDGGSAGIALPTTTSTDLPLQFFAHPSTRTVKTLFLPSQWHQNPRFRPFPWQSAPLHPPTPLNSFLMHLFNNATTSIYIQTPNLTSPPVLAALISALARGIHLKIITNERLMLIEQLVTAGSTTSICIQRMIKAYERQKQQHHETQSLFQREESATVLGKLHISYFEGLAGRGEREDLMPVSSHLKLTVVDGEVLVLGSGNMDRASWFTSQELGLAFADAEMAARMLEMVEKVNGGSCRVVYDG